MGRFTSGSSGYLKLVQATLGMLLLALVGAPSSSVVAGDFRVDEVIASDGQIDCLAHKWRYLLFQTSGPCDTFTPPTTVRLGENFSADGKTRRIGVIVANQADEDIELPPGHGRIMKGQWTCVAAETADDLPSDEDRKRTWLYIRNCQPVR